MKHHLIHIVITSVAGMACLFIASACSLTKRPSADTTSFVAYSLKQAERQLRQDPAPAGDVRTLGGMTRLAGLVYDRPQQDLILVGQVAPGERGITVDDLAVAIRARLVANQWPLVSIDRTHDTPATGMQTVRFEGGVAGSSYGTDLLQADIVLKKMGLGLAPQAGSGIRSYVDLSADDARGGADLRTVTTRFWFVPVRAAIAEREDVMAIQDLVIGVHAQVMNAAANEHPGTSASHLDDPPGERFAQALTDNYTTLCAERPEIRRLKVLFDLAGLAEGIRTLPERPDLNYWLTEYVLPPVQTPGEQPLLKTSIPINTKNGSCTMTVDGGIELRALVSNLRGGDVTALRDLVLKSRPASDTLVWRVPLYGWNIPGAPPAPDTGQDADMGQVTGKLGTTMMKDFTGSLSHAVEGAVGGIHGMSSFPPLNTFASPVHFTEGGASGIRAPGTAGHPGGINLAPDVVPDRSRPMTPISPGHLGGVLLAPRLAGSDQGGAQLRDQVLRSRPTGGAASWQTPLDGGNTR